jgi:hypothetical protein
LYPFTITVWSIASSLGKLTIFHFTIPFICNQANTIIRDLRSSLKYIPNSYLHLCLVFINIYIMRSHTWLLSLMWTIQHSSINMKHLLYHEYYNTS